MTDTDKENAFLVQRTVKRSKKGGLTIHQHFDDWDTLIDYVEAQPVADTWSDNGRVLASEEPGADSATKNMGEAISLARYGWENGRAHMNDAARNVTETMSTESSPLISLDVAGAYPVAALAAAGEPLNMVHLEPTENRIKHVFRLVVETIYPHHVEPRSVNNWGGAIVSWIDAVESRGHRVELLGGYPSKGVRGGDKFFPTVTLKEANQPVEIDRLAFMLAHPANLRRLFFRLVETHGELKKDFGLGMGCATDTPKAMLTGFGARIPGPSNATCNTPENALAYIESYAKEVVTEAERNKIGETQAAA